MVQGRVTILGSGGSLGVPIVGCSCQVCQSSSPLNRRMRPSILLEIEGNCFVVDVGPDFREQALRFHIHHVDGVFLTHTHYDHCAGFDELQPYYHREHRPIPCLLSREAFRYMKHHYPHLFCRPKGQELFLPHILKGKEGTTKFVGMEVHYFSYPQHGVQVSGFRIDSFAYMTDVMELDESMYRWLDGVEWLVMNGKGWEGSPAHLSLGEAIAFAKKVGARTTYFTHISHDIDHLIDSEKLPEKTKFAYDGLTFEIEAFFETEEVADR